MKIVDAFIFYNELDLLRYRLTVLNKHVDYFVLVEATLTHAGNPKPLFYEDNKKLFAEFEHKVVHVIVDDFPKTKDAWVRERFQRNCISRGLSQLDVKTEDLIIVSDLDEIPNPKSLDILRKEGLTDICALKQDMYYYDLETLVQDDWLHPKVVSYDFFLNTLKSQIGECRLILPQKIMRKAGWHLGYFGYSAELIQNKLKQFAHQEYSKISKDDIEVRLGGRVDLFDRDMTFTHIPLAENKNLPPRHELLLAMCVSSVSLPAPSCTTPSCESVHEDAGLSSNKSQSPPPPSSPVVA